MKKVLFATTALIATAGMAAADVTLSGTGRLGLLYTSGTNAVAATGTAAQQAAARAAVTTAELRTAGLGLAAATATGVVTANTAAGTVTAAQIAAAAAAEAAFDAGVANAASVLNAIDGTAAVSSIVRLEKRVSINIDGSGETDGGLSFGGRIRLRSNEGATNSDVAAANLFIGNDTWRVTVGNTQGAMVNRVGYFQGSVGLTGLHYANVSFNIGANRWGLATYSSSGNAGTVVRLDFNVGDFGVSLSADGAADLSNTGENSIAVSYNFGDWTVAAGYADDTTLAGTGTNTMVAGGDMWSLSAVGSIGDFGVGLGYSDRDNVGSKITLNGSYNFGDTTVTAFVAKTSEDALGSANIGAAGSETEYGIGFTHSLGGATLAGGVSRNYAKNTMADLGVRFSF